MGLVLAYRLLELPPEELPAAVRRWALQWHIPATARIELGSDKLVLSQYGCTISASWQYVSIWPDRIGRRPVLWLRLLEWQTDPLVRNAWIRRKFRNNFLVCNGTTLIDPAPYGLTAHELMTMMDPYCSFAHQYYAWG